MKNRLAGWKVKALSQGGRAVLIGSVLQAIPTYSMQTFILPIGLCEELDSIMRKFFWGAKDNKAHYVALKTWDCLTLPKQAGGMGFRRMVDQNKALVMKLTWHMVNKSEKQWCKIFTAKYLKHKKMLDIKSHPPDSSWVWQSICSCVETVRENTCFTIGDGSDIYIWKDAWIPTLENFKPPLQYKTDESPFRVSDLLSPSGEWNSSLLHTLFPPEICLQISKINIPSSREPISPCWLPSKPGNFTVKSAYLTVIARRLPINPSIPRQVWRKVGKTKLHGRHKHMLWRLLQRTLPVKTRIYYLRSVSDLGCVLCQNSEETIEHLFIQCPIIRNVMFNSKWDFRFPDNLNMIVDWIDILLDPQSLPLLKGILRDEFLNYYLVAVDQIWRIRNEILFKQGKLEFEALTRIIHKVAEENWRTQLKRIVGCNTTQFEIEWIAPNAGWIKINCDVAMAKDLSCIAWLARNANGRIVAAFADIQPAISVDEGEARAVLEALKCGVKVGVTKLIVESDSAHTIEALLGANSMPDRTSQHIIANAKINCSAIPNIRVRKIPRNCNRAAHNLASWAMNRLWKGVVPLNIIPHSVFCDTATTDSEIVAGFAELYK